MIDAVKTVYVSFMDFLVDKAIKSFLFIIFYLRQKNKIVRFYKSAVSTFALSTTSRSIRVTFYFSLAYRSVDCVSP